MNSPYAAFHRVFQYSASKQAPFGKKNREKKIQKASWDGFTKVCHRRALNSTLLFCHNRKNYMHFHTEHGSYPSLFLFTLIITWNGNRKDVFKLNHWISDFLPLWQVYFFPQHSTLFMKAKVKKNKTYSFPPHRKCCRAGNPAASSNPILNTYIFIQVSPL